MKKLKKSNNESQPVTTATNCNPADLMSMMNGMGGNMMMPNGMVSPMMDNTVVDHQPAEPLPAIVDTESVVTEESLTGDLPYFRYDICNVVPLCISEEKLEENKYVIVLKLLCKDCSGNLIILARSYGLESKEELDAVSELPLFDEKYFINTKLSANLLVEGLPAFTTELDFTAEDSSCSVIYVTGTSIDGTANSEEKETRFYLTTDVYSCINYIDYYIFASINNQHDLGLAVAVGYKTPSYSPIFMVDKIEKIINIAPVDNKVKRKSFKKKDISTAVGIIVKVSRFVSTTEREIAQILIPMVLDKKFDKSKFKGKTMSDIMETYCTDSDQYISTLNAPDSRIFGVDKEYTMIRGENKDNQSKIFLLDASILEELDQMVYEF